jgi:hypothetical protein
MGFDIRRRHIQFKAINFWGFHVLPFCTMHITYSYNLTGVISVYKLIWLFYHISLRTHATILQNFSAYSHNSSPTFIYIHAYSPTSLCTHTIILSHLYILTWQFSHISLYTHMSIPPHLFTYSRDYSTTSLYTLMWLFSHISLHTHGYSPTFFYILTWPFSHTLEEFDYNCNEKNIAWFYFVGNDQTDIWCCIWYTIIENSVATCSDLFNALHMHVKVQKGKHRCLHMVQ